MSDIDNVKARLQRAIANADGDEFEDALNELFSLGAGVPGGIARLLAPTLAMRWHQRHEDVVLALQQARDPSTVDALYAAAHDRHDYLAYDEFFGLARKCTWALADIGSEHARSRLEELARCPEPKVRGYAQKRLDNWEREVERKASARGRPTIERS
jgi:hypothetical protein